MFKRFLQWARCTLGWHDISKRLVGIRKKGEVRVLLADQDFCKSCSWEGKLKPIGRVRSSRGRSYPSRGKPPA